MILPNSAFPRSKMESTARTSLLFSAISVMQFPG
jgi:hypothetical protein